MEPFDIDKIIKNKILESSDLHNHELTSAKPFVWSEVQNQIKRKNSLKWYHLAAAIAFLIIGFSMILHNIQKQHRHEIEKLSAKIDQTQNNYLSQAELLNIKNNQVESLRKKLNNLELRLVYLQKQKPLSQKETIVYLTDTVYLKQVEYITSVSDPVESEEIATSALENQWEQTETDKQKEVETDDVIFPSYSNQGNRQQSETIKFKFGSITVRKN